VSESLGGVNLVIECGVATITLDRPGKHNALTLAMQAQLADAVAAVGADDQVRAVVLHGEGRSFCAGVDIREAKPPAPSTQRGLWQRERDNMLARIGALPVPVIAAVQGHALGRGLDLVLAADLRFVTPSALLGYPEVERGMIVGGGGPRRLARLIGEARAAEMLLCGTAVDGASAHAWGLASWLVAEEDLLQQAQSLAQTLATRPGPAMYLAKATIRQGAEVSAAAGAWTDSAFNLLGISER
jgi:enoyl-CoA hydratase/carnithine racemase